MNDKIPRTIRHVLRAAPAAALATGVVCPAALADPGDLDPTFADVGRFTPPDDLGGRAQSLVTQEDNYVFAGGELEFDFFTYETDTLGFADRLLVDGTLDADFNAPDLADTLVVDTATQPDNKIVGVGRRHDVYIVFRLELDGALDAGFGVNGVREMTDGTTLSSIAVDPAETIVVAGTQGADLKVLRLLANGDLDDSFGAAGVFTAPADTADEQIQALPRVVSMLGGGYRVTDNDYAAAGTSRCRVLALTVDGNVNETFGDHGYSELASTSEVITCDAMIESPDGGLLVSGADGLKPVLIKLIASGAPDPAFGLLAHEHEKKGALMTLRLVLSCLALSTFGVLSVSFAQENSGGAVIQGPHEGGLGAPVEMNIDLSKVPIETLLRRREPIEVPLRRIPEEAPVAPSKEQTPVLPEKWKDLFRVKLPEFSMPNPNFDGIKLFDPGAFFVPPDANGDAGRNHYVQTVNSSIAVFDKQGNTLAGPMPINTLFAPLGGVCATDNVIDPLVNYDPLADRWIVLGFPFDSPICIAVSRTSDPVTGGWFLYQLDVSAFGFPDYPKLGVWRDAYYLATQRGFHGGGLDLYALDRANMLSGNLAKFVHFFVVPSSGFLLPADLDGRRPPRRARKNDDEGEDDDDEGEDEDDDELNRRPPRLSTPAPFVGHVDGDLWGGVDRLEVYEFSVNFKDPASSTFSFVADLPTEPFSAVLCGDIFFGDCAEQPNGIPLETLPAWLMWRVQYRNFGKYETLVANHTIDVDELSDERAGIRWYELRRYHRKQWAIFQQGTFAPQDPFVKTPPFLHRWMGSIAMDRKGNIALGFSASSSSLFPSVRYVGRMATDPLGLMPRGGSPDGDFLMVAGEGSQVSSTRWGDYSSMSLDPVDGCTFWYTQEYVGSEGFWRTRIGAFKFPSCRPQKIAGERVE
jgi:uncharacterized delta-60 repeat protein